MLKYLYPLLLFPAIVFCQSNFEKGEKFFKQEKYILAKPFLNSSLQQNPDHEKTREYLGDIAAYSKDWDTALSIYKELVSEKPNNADYNFKYGGSLAMKAKESSRIRALTYISDIKSYIGKAVELDPSHIEARWAMMELYMQLPSILGGSEKSAMQYADQLMAISPVDGHLAKGNVAEHFGKTIMAEKHYKQAIALGDSPHTYDKLANLYENKKNNPEKAIQTRETSLRKHQLNNLNYQIGKISAMYNIELQKGLAYLHAFLDNYSGKDMLPKEMAYYRIAQIHKYLGNKKEAESWINKALVLDNGFKEAQEEKRLIQSL